MRIEDLCELSKNSCYTYRTKISKLITNECRNEQIEDFDDIKDYIQNNYSFIEKYEYFGICIDLIAEDVCDALDF